MIRPQWSDSVNSPSGIPGTIQPRFGSRPIPPTLQEDNAASGRKTVVSGVRNPAVVVNRPLPHAFGLTVGLSRLIIPLFKT